MIAPRVQARPKNAHRRMYARPAPETRFSAYVRRARARDSGNKIADSAHGMGSGDLAVDVMVIGCLGVDRRGERIFVLSHFLTL